jgi:tripartite-type tricarboxylate transporter receptor subunit TctC
MFAKTAALAAAIPLLAACGGVPANTPNSGEAYPANCQSINFIIGYSAGGTSDLVFRALGDQFATLLEKDVQVINVPGGGGSVAINQMKAAPHDGCTLGNAAVPSQLQYLFPEVPAGYTKEDFAFVGGFGDGPQALAVPADSPYNSLDDLVKAAKADGSLTAVVDAAKGGDAIVNAEFARTADIKIRQVVVDGSAEKVTTLLSGQVDFANGALGGLLPSAESGQLKLLAVWSAERNDAIPDVPTATEQGIDVVQESRVGVLTPAGVPDASLEKLQETLKAATKNADFKKHLSDIGITASFATGKQYSEIWDEMAETIKSIDFNSLT